MISNSNYQIDSYVSEIEVAKLKVGQIATTTIDAYGLDTPFVTKIVSVAPASTIQNGVASYKITLQFEKPDARIKSGMNSNSYIIISSKENVIAVPEESIIKKDSDEYVIVSDSLSKKQEYRKVITGITGGGYVEITSGLSEGESIVSFNSDNK